MSDQARVTQDPETDIAVVDLRSAFRDAPIGMAVLTPTGTLTAVNTQLTRLLDRASEHLVGTTLFGVTHPDDLALCRHNCELMAAGRAAVLRHECRFVRADGTPVWVLASTSRVEETDVRSSHLIMHVEDITERKALEGRLRHAAMHDPLTGLGNRSLLQARIEEDRPGTDSLLVLDLDGFKSVNDTYGHLVGDQLLRALADRLSVLLRPQDVAVRLGGDEFAVLCADTEQEQAERIVDRLRTAAVEPFTIEGHVISLGVAVGVGTHVRPPDAPDSPDPGAMAALLHQADRAMYADKRSRR